MLLRTTLVTVIALSLGASWAIADPADPPERLGQVTLTRADGATRRDRRLLRAVARELSHNESLWESGPTGQKTFRLRTYRSGDVRQLTELSSTVENPVACKLLRHRLWRLPLGSKNQVRTLVVRFRFRPLVDGQVTALR
jgi:hypothetical protein